MPSIVELMLEAQFHLIDLSLHIMLKQHSFPSFKCLFALWLTKNSCIISMTYYSVTCSLFVVFWMSVERNRAIKDSRIVCPSWPSSSLWEALASLSLSEARQ